MSLATDGTPLYYHPDFFELQEYLGPLFKLDWCDARDDKAETEALLSTDDNDTFMRSTMVFAYQNIGLMTRGIHRPYLAKLLEYTAEQYGVTILDVGAGGGQIGLALHTLGYKVSFADIYSQSMFFLLWRLRQKKLDLPVYCLDFDGAYNQEIPRHNICVCFDVLEHLPRDEQTKLLEKMGDKWGEAIFVNLVRDSKHPGIHGDVNFDFLTNFVSQRWTTTYSDHYPEPGNGTPRQRLLIYGTAVHPIESTISFLKI